jgi:hypothetical protein
LSFLKIKMSISEMNGAQGNLCRKECWLRH